MAVGGVIDLGEVRPGPERAVPRPVRTPVRWRFTWALAGLAVVATTLGPALPEAAPLTEATIPARLGDTAFAVGEQFYVVTSGRTELAGARTISAYTLPGATRLWQAPLPLTGALRGVGAVAGQMLLSTQPELLEQVESVSIREASGQVMWRRRALFEGVTPGGQVLLWTSPDGTPSASTGRETLEAVDPVTGAVRWAYRVPAGAWLSYRYADRSPTHVVTLLPSGTVEVREVEQARVLAAADLLPARPPSTPASYVQFAGDMVLVRDGPTVVAYGVDGLDRRWSAAIDLATEYVTPGCGDKLCVVRHLGGVRVLDPATGRTLWTDRSRVFVSRAGDYLVGQARGRDGFTQLTALDPETGRELNRLGEWTVIAPPTAAGELIAMRTDLATSRAWLARIDPATGGAHFFGVVGGVTGDCEVRSGAVICRRLDATVGVWRPVPLP
ncbi:PQQ-binding-like beta-propeller repeat protein [Phytohabitans sp. ZYX-F-186]|uniref:PQQ-binding-like beta-propeller repeat protein n=1 Tax=Phytohabitans maris TaxID=3071409 RepID=A0ABU0ZHJ3_9ACTN|nr:PQQ-binding-like beta-propeller repeat protein [Phytohabitans sp. ZYX-F-186]MDQ7906529.1 PQQ-binding-like beta-propeller repeat protein [Phytohabitans sp. ZYX-F-186]